MFVINIKMQNVAQSLASVSDSEGHMTKAEGE